MITEMTLNINHEAVFDGVGRRRSPLSQPMKRSNTIQRIQLAEISRDMVDQSPIAMAHIGSLSYDVIMSIDTEL